MSALPAIPFPNSQALSDLLDANLRFSPEYKGKLTNHLPMALHALQQLGAPPQRLQAFFSTYERRLRPSPPLPSNDVPADWRSLLGKVEAYPKLRATFTHWVDRDGAEQVLHDALPALVPGVAAAAFHGAIRTAHAVESGHRREIAAALAYWACRWSVLEEPENNVPTLPLDLWEKCLIEEAKGWQSSGDLIFVRMADATRSSAYQRLAAGPALEVTPPAAVSQLAQLARTAASFYVACPNFTVLHMITGLRALRKLLPWMDGCGQVTLPLACAFSAAYLSASVIRPDSPPIALEITWRQAIDLAIASDNDHVIKLVHACVEESEAYGEDSYLQVARLALR
jgi:hypothetical protein